MVVSDGPRMAPLGVGEPGHVRRVGGSWGTRSTGWLVLLVRELVAVEAPYREAPDDPESPLLPRVYYSLVAETAERSGWAPAASLRWTHVSQDAGLVRLGDAVTLTLGSSWTPAPDGASQYRVRELRELADEAAGPGAAQYSWACADDREEPWAQEPDGAPFREGGQGTASLDAAGALTLDGFVRVEWPAAPVVDAGQGQGQE